MNAGDVPAILLAVLTVATIVGCVEQWRRDRNADD